MLAIIGGSGLTRLSTLAVAHREVVRTPYGDPSSTLLFGQIAGRDAVFLARHVDPPIVALAWGVFIGGVVQLGFQLPAMARIGMLPRPRIDLRDPGVRRVLRGLLDAGQSVQKDPGPAARMLGDVAPYLGDPTEAIRSAPPATLADNRAFFGLSGEAPVTYDELFQSASALFQKLKRGTVAPPAEDTRDLGALKYVSEARGP